jgi:hypothetical protein
LECNKGGASTNERTLVQQKSGWENLHGCGTDQEYLPGLSSEKKMAELKKMAEGLIEPFLKNYIQMLEVVSKSGRTISAVWLLIPRRRIYEMMMMIRSTLISFIDIMSHLIFYLHSSMQVMFSLKNSNWQDSNILLSLVHT